jgi:hypothetical protein
MGEWRIDGVSPWPCFGWLCFVWLTLQFKPHGRAYVPKPTRHAACRM